MGLCVVCGLAVAIMGLQGLPNRSPYQGSTQSTMESKGSHKKSKGLRGLRRTVKSDPGLKGIEGKSSPT